MAEDVEDPDQGGGEASGVWPFLLRRLPFGVDIWCRDVGCYPLHGTGTGWFLSPGGAATGRAAVTAEVG